MSTTSGPPSGSGGQKTLSGVYALSIPPDMRAWGAVRQMVADPGVRMDEVSREICSDPALVIHVLKASSSMHYSAGKPPVTTIKSAMERLGGNGAVETLESLKDIPPIENPDVVRWIEVGRRRGRHCGRISRIWAEVLAQSLAEDAHVTGALGFTGDILAPMHFGEVFTRIAAENPRVKVLYKLEKDHNFDLEKVGVSYLTRIGIPDSITFALDPAGQTKTPSRAVLKPICAAAIEMTMAFELDKWDKFAPGGAINPKSAIKLIKMTEAQYTTVYERAGQYLFEERRKEVAKPQ